MKKIYSVVFLFTCFSNYSYSQWTPDIISNARDGLQAAMVGNTIYFVGGYGEDTMESTVDIFNTSTKKWESPTNISSPRTFTASVGGDSALYVAGGTKFEDKIWLGTNVVDILKNGKWTKYLLADSFFNAAAVHVGTKILISGAQISYNETTGKNKASNKVYIYDELTKIWTTEFLSEARCNTAVASNGIIAIFAGGLNNQHLPSKVVDIYNSVSKTWSTATLSEARTLVSGVFAGGKFYFAGGAKDGVNNSSDVVDIFDGTAWTTAKLSKARAGIAACTAGNKIFFTGGGDLNLPSLFYSNSLNNVDIYDFSLSKWTTSPMNYDKVSHAAIGFGNKAYVAGGYSFSNSTLDAVEIWDITADIRSINNSNKIIAYPNPALEVLKLSGYENISKIKTLEILTCTGSLVSKIEEIQAEIDVSFLPDGLYFINIKCEEGTSTLKFIKQ